MKVLFVNEYYFSRFTPLILSFVPPPAVRTGASCKPLSRCTACGGTNNSMERKEPPHNHSAIALHYAENLPLISRPFEGKK
jgi:hypothetical protein